MESLHRGGVVIVGGSAALTLALTWGGLQFPWTSAQVLIPLVIGIVALICFFPVERYCATEPIVSAALVLRFRLTAVELTFEPRFRGQSLLTAHH